MDVKQAIRDYDWDIIILHPDCTALAVSGSFYYGTNKPNNFKRVEAVEWTTDLWNMACAKARVGVALENPLSVVFQHLAHADVQMIHPWQFGHPEKKATGLALYSLPRLAETANVYREMQILPKHLRERNRFISPSKNRKRDRSVTYSGIAAAFVVQWGLSTMSAHAACSLSSANMWLACPASVTLTKDVPRPSSRYAKEGTAAHQVAEMTLKGDIFLPDKITVEGDEYIVSPGMCRALNPYVTHVQSLMGPYTEMVLEKRIKVPNTFNMVWGTLDCGAFTKGELHVVDLKFGKGVAVDPASPQLRFYALGLADLLEVTIPDAVVHLTICQPRIGGEAIRTRATTLGELWQWLDFEVDPALRKIKAGDTTENAGAHCRWCVRQTECKAFAAKHQTHASAVFDDLP